MGVSDSVGVDGTRVNFFEVKFVPLLIRNHILWLLTNDNNLTHLVFSNVDNSTNLILIARNSSGVCYILGKQKKSTFGL